MILNYYSTVPFTSSQYSLYSSSNFSSKNLKPNFSLSSINAFSLMYGFSVSKFEPRTSSMSFVASSKDGTSVLSTQYIT